MLDIFAFYSSVLDEEIKFFNVSPDRFKQSLAAVNSAYSPESLKNGKTYLDYNIASHRCAYLYKFGPCHTELLYINFCFFVRNVPEVYSILKEKTELKICCLGGGAGSDVVGMVKALVSFKCLQKKVIEITVLDICGGWRNCFKKIMQKLKEDKGDVSGAFLDKENLAAKLMAVDLTETPSDAALTVIKEADIFCMVKFVSAVISKPSAKEAFKNLASHMKAGAVVIFIDNFSDKVYKPIDSIFSQAGLRCVYGPHHARFKVNGTFPSKYTYLPSRLRSKSTSVSVLGWVKSSVVSVPYADMGKFPLLPQKMSFNGASYGGEFESTCNSDYGRYQQIEKIGDSDDDFSSDESPSSTDEANSYEDQSTQTVECPNEADSGCLERKLSLLASRLNNLESLVKNFVARKCSHNVAPSCCDTSDHIFLPGRQQHGIDNSSCSSKCAPNDHLRGHHHHRAAGVENAPFLVLPVRNLLCDEQHSALLSLSLSGNAAN